MKRELYEERNKTDNNNKERNNNRRNLTIPYFFNLPYILDLFIYLFLVVVTTKLLFIDIFVNEMFLDFLKSNLYILHDKIAGGNHALFFQVVTSVIDKYNLS